MGGGPSRAEPSAAAAAAGYLHVPRMSSSWRRMAIYMWRMSSSWRNGSRRRVDSGDHWQASADSGAQHVSSAQPSSECNWFEVASSRRRKQRF